MNENEKAAGWLLTSVFNDLKIPLIIAGKDPSPSLKNLASRNSGNLITSPSNDKLHDLIQNAQINILPSFNNTGIKLKLLNAIFNGRHCVVNKAGIEGSGIDDCCHISKSADEFKSVVTQLFEQPFSDEERRNRITAVENIYNNEKNARQLIAWIY